MTEQPQLFEDCPEDEMDWKAYKEEQRLRRENNASRSMLLLAEEGINFISRNGGVHLIIEDHCNMFDFWPSTGKWMQRTRGTQTYFRGVRNLLDTIKKARPK